MRFIKPNTHAIIDYAMSIILILSPWLLNFSRNGAETWVPVIIGIATLGISSITKYKYSLKKIIPMRDHLMIDMVSGIVLAISPWIFGFSNYVFLPHLIFGIMEIGASLTTETTYRPGRPKTQNV